MRDHQEDSRQEFGNIPLCLMYRTVALSTILSSLHLYILLARLDRLGFDLQETNVSL